MRRLFYWLAAACFLAMAAPAAGAALGKGALLVAARELPGPVFEETVILILNYDADAGAMGVIVNHPTEVQPSEVMPNLRGLESYRGPMYLGGPVELNVLLALVRTEKAPKQGLRIFGQVYLVPPEAALARTPGRDASRLRFFVGYAGWAPGQLENEIARGDWHVRAATEDAVFSADAAGLWRKLVPPKGIQTAGRKAPAVL